MVHIRCNNGTMLRWWCVTVSNHMLNVKRNECRLYAGMIDTWPADRRYKQFCSNLLLFFCSHRPDSHLISNLSILRLRTLVIGVYLLIFRLRCFHCPVNTNSYVKCCSASNSIAFCRTVATLSESQRPQTHASIKNWNSFIASHYVRASCPCSFCIVYYSPCLRFAYDFD